jgi:hypothetical protein
MPCKVTCCTVTCCRVARGLPLYSICLVLWLSFFSVLKIERLTSCQHTNSKSASVWVQLMLILCQCDTSTALKMIEGEIISFEKPLHEVAGSSPISIMCSVVLQWLQVTWNVLCWNASSWQRVRCLQWGDSYRAQDTANSLRLLVIFQWWAVSSSSRNHFLFRSISSSYQPLPNSLFGFYSTILK